MICPNCKQPVEDGAFCPYCGTPLVPSAPTAQPSYAAPPHNGNQQPYAAAPYAGAPQPPKKKKTALIVGIAAAAAVVVAAVVLLIVLLGGNSDDKTKDSRTAADGSLTAPTAAEFTAEPTTADAIATQPPTEAPTEAFKAGLIAVEDENSAYDLNFITAFEDVCDELGVEAIVKTNVYESSDCHDAAVDLAEEGCGFIFGNSYGHEYYLIQAAGEYPDVEFGHASGVRAHTEGLDNYHNAYAATYEGRYLAGVAAGMKLNEMISSGKIKANEAKIGYVGAFSYAEVVSDYTAFFLGARSVCPSATMEVQFAGAWSDNQAENEAAKALIKKGCVLISQHSDSMGAPSACEDAGVPNIGYNVSAAELCPKTSILSSRINWRPYFRYAIQAAMNGEKMPADWTGTLLTGSVELTDINDQAAAPGTGDKLTEVRRELEDGTLHVFDTATFTLDGKILESYMADVDPDNEYTPDTEVVSGGFFHECEYRSAPYFDLQIDGITLLNHYY